MKRVAGLDLLRAFAIVWVVFFHAWILDLGTPWLDGSRFGWMGVDLFFALSGYLIGKQWLTALRDGKASFAEFYLRRAFRIFPAFLVIVAVYFVFPQRRDLRHGPHRTDQVRRHRGAPRRGRVWLPQRHVVAA